MQTLILGTMVAMVPVLTITLTNRQIRKLKVLDWGREDEVARRADERAEALLGELTETKAIAVITHDLVNSSYTEAKQSELDQTEISLFLMRQAVARDLVDRVDTTGEAYAAITAAELKIEKLKTLIADRLRQTKVAEPVKVQVVNAPTEPVPVVNPESK